MNFNYKNLLYGLIFSFFLTSFAFAGGGHLPDGSNLTDEKITAKVETELMFQEDVPAERIDVSTDNHVVTLRGFSSNLRAKEMAGRVAMAVKGVEAVINHIEVLAPYRPDEKILADIESAFRTDPATEAFDINTSVVKGRVTLSGELDSWQETQLAEYVASNIYGVKAIENELTFVPDYDRSDFEIKTEIDLALQSDIRIESDFVTVNVKNGEVLLTGETGSLNEKEQILYYAWTSGVRNVDAKNLKVKDWLSEANMKPANSPYKASDMDVEAFIYRAFTYEPRLKGAAPEVNVTDGVAYLSGTVNNLKARRAAESATGNIEGVNFIYNNIKVKTEMKTNPKLEDDVINAILRNSELNRHEISANAVNGRIYLTGVVDNSYQKHLAEDVTAAVKGVLAIRNNISVDDPFEDHLVGYYAFDWNNFYPTPYVNYAGISPVSDDQIETNIKNEFWWSPEVTEATIDVEVVAGTAHLTGEIDSERERWLAVQNAYEGGARSVVESLKIK